jgi:hypothetical protein
VKFKKEVFILILASILATFLVWLPFLLGFKDGMLTVFKNYDGPNYLVVAKSWYDKNFISTSFSLPTPLEYYPAHLPGYPLTISFLNIFFPGPWAMLVSTLVFTLLSVTTFYLLLLKFRLSENPFWLSLVFLVLPARWVVVKAVGSPEPLFIFAILASFYFFKNALAKINYDSPPTKFPFVSLFFAGLFGAVAQVTKIPAILLFVTYLIFLFCQAFPKTKPKPRLPHLNDIYHLSIKPGVPLLLIPLSLILVFGFYRLQTSDFLAYFHSGDNFHLVFPPFQSFAAGRSWLGDFWREDMVWQYLLGALTLVLLLKQRLYDLASFAGVFFAATLFVAHRDLARYSLPLTPFSLIAFDKFIQKKEFKIALLITLPAIYLYAINFIAGNTAPVADWTPYL